MRIAPRVIIIGAGLSGLCCAIKLQEAEIPYLLLEQSKSVGGRVQTDQFEDYRLDRGFQVFFTGYPEAKRMLDYDALNLHSFHSGALVRWGGGFHKISDLFHHPLDVFTTVLTPIGTVTDKLKLAELRQKSLNNSIDRISQHNETSTQAFLEGEGFSPSMIDRFFRPFLGGILLDKNLSASSHMFEFVFAMLSSGGVALPAGGMGAITQQLVKKLTPGTIRTNAKVLSLQDGIVNLAQGETLGAEAIVVATEAFEASRLIADFPTRPGKSVMCLYYAALKPPIEEPILILNGENKGPVNNMCVLSNVCPTYAAEGHSLISVSVLGYNDEAEELEFEAIVRKQLVDWFPEDAIKWRYLKTYKIKHAQPDQTPPALASMERPIKLRQGLYVCGDHRDTASINGAMASGRRTAETIIADLPP